MYNLVDCAEEKRLTICADILCGVFIAMEGRNERDLMFDFRYRKCLEDQF